MTTRKSFLSSLLAIPAALFARKPAVLTASDNQEIDIPDGILCEWGSLVQIDRSRHAFVRESVVYLDGKRESHATAVKTGPYGYVIRYRTTDGGNLVADSDRRPAMEVAKGNVRATIRNPVYVELHALAKC